MTPPFGYWHLSSAALLGFVIGVVLTVGWPRSESYDECVLRETRGLPNDMSTIVYEVCRKRHPQ
jgi:hypothetical protein